MNKGTGLALTFAIALAAIRLFGGNGIAPTAPHTAAVQTPHTAAVAPTRQPKHRRTPSPGLYLGLEGCAAYSEDTETEGKTYPEKVEKGEAASILDAFFQTHAGTPLQLLPSVHVAIALAPDPRHTQLSVSFDREMNAIQAAAQDEGFIYNASWMPWATDGTTYSSLSDGQRNADLTGDREACPGVLLFRRYANTPGAQLTYQGSYAQGLVVFVVGEQPTGGINRTQWANAIHWIHTYAPQTHDRLYVLGPTFSGSVVSLGRELQTLPACFKHVQVLSGSVSSRNAVDWLRRNNAANKPPVPQIVFGTFQENDDLQIQRFLAYWKIHGAHPQDTAILSEDETIYGNDPLEPEKQPSSSATPPDQLPLYLYYPRDLSALRLQYQKESVFSTGAPSGERSVHSVLQDGAEPTEDSHAGTDTISNYSGHVTPLAQEAVLYGLVTDLRTHHSRFVLLRCTNPLDYLFLTRFLHRAYPEGRIVLVGQDLLLRREIDNTEFRGVMGLSNYPLIPRDDHWSMLIPENQPSVPHAHRVFESQNAEGAYLAARYTFDQTVPQPPAVQRCSVSTPPPSVAFVRQLNLPGYANPFWLDKPGTSLSTTNAPTWLTVLGRDGFWPIAVLNDQTAKLACPSAFPSTLVSLDATGFRHEPNTFDLPLAWKAAALFILALVFYQIYGLWRKTEYSSTGLFSVFRLADIPSQQLLLAISCALVTLLALEAASVSLALYDATLFKPCPDATLAWIMTTIALVSPVAFLALIAFRQHSWSLRLSALVTLLTLALLECYAWTYIGGNIASNEAAAVPLFYRMGHLTSGVSPLLPALFITAGFYLWIWQAMAGSQMLGVGRPRLPPCKFTEPTWNPWEDSCLVIFWQWAFGPSLAETASPFAIPPLFVRVSQRMANRIVYMASPLWFPKAVWIPAVAIGVTIVTLFHNEPLLLGMEGGSFTFAINAALTVALVITLAEASRLFWTWDELRRLLSALGRMRLRRTFTRLRAIPQSSLWSVSGNTQIIQHSFFAQQWDAACRLKNLGYESDPLEAAVNLGLQFQLDGLPQFNAGLTWNVPPSSAIATNPLVRDTFNGAVAEVMTHLLVPKWKREESSLVVESDAVETDAAKAALSMAICPNPIIQTAEEFVCLHYIAFIQIILARMRTMVLSMMYLFIAVCLAISFYPFVPRTQITVWMLLNLVIIGATVIYVYAGMERDETLSYITDTPPGKLGTEFWLKSAAFLAGPLLGLLTTQFPAISDSLLAWLQPGLDAFK